MADGRWIDNYQFSHFNESKIVVFPGGGDINPAYYGHKEMSGAHHNSYVDEREFSLLQKAIDSKKFIVGVCRGAQWLTVAAGGWLIQDVSGHQISHEIETYDGQIFRTNSSHHQMCYPFDLKEGVDYKLLAWSMELSNRYIIENNEDMRKTLYGGSFKEPEIIWYPKIRGLAIQGHPEWPSFPKDLNQWVNKLILSLL